MNEPANLQHKVFMDRYALRNTDGVQVESSPAQMWDRVAKAIAQVERTEDEREGWETAFRGILDDFKFVPGGRILSGAGTGTGVTYYNCYVIPSPEDSRSGILDNLKVMTEIMARGGGVGINLSTLRPRGSYIKTVNGTASGPCSWAELYSVATGDVIQQGGSRRGALMLMLNDDHPDILEFINVKRDLKKINHANLSICISDGFMHAVKTDATWPLVWGGKTHSLISARKLWDEICHAAWSSGEPGLVFIDRYNTESNTWYYEKIICVNPCGEQGLPEWGVCNLGALNLSAFVDGGEGYEPGRLDLVGLGRAARVAMRFLDNVVDSNLYFIPENEEAQKGTRRTGLGTMGLADALIKLHIPYGSPESIEVITDIYATIRDAAYEASVDNAIDKGAFSHFDATRYAQGRFIQRLPVQTQERIARHGIRNAVLLTQAPTGSTSLVAGVSSGIEPVFAFSMVRRDRIGEHVIHHPLVESWRRATGTTDADPLPAWFVSANDLTPEQHVAVQATIQRYTDSSISKTVNAPNDHTVEQVQTLYMAAYDQGCKGVTYFRDGCRAGVLSHIVPPAESPRIDTDTTSSALRERPAVVDSQTHRTATPLGTMFTTVTRDDTGPLEVFLQVGKAGTDTASVTEAIGRLISLVLRVPPRMSPSDRLAAAAEQLQGIGGGRQVGIGPRKVRSLPDAVAQVLTDYITGVTTPANDTATASPPATMRSADLCPECGDAALVQEEGCKKCYSCGYSEC